MILSIMELLAAFPDMVFNNEVYSIHSYGRVRGNVTDVYKIGRPTKFLAMRLIITLTCPT